MLNPVVTFLQQTLSASDWTKCSFSSFILNYETHKSAETDFSKKASKRFLSITYCR